MNHTYKCALALTLLASNTYTDFSMNYKNVTMLASVGIATTITATMLYNFIYPTSDQIIIDQAATKCQSVKKLYNDISLVHETEITPKSGQYSLYYYVSNLDTKINQLQEKLEELACLQTNLLNRSPKNSDENFVQLQINFEHTLSDIQTVRTELKDLITKLFAIRTNIASSTQYADELALYRSNQSEYTKDESHDRYSAPIVATEEEKMKATDTSMKVTEDTVMTVDLSRGESFNENWCDATNPFNS